MNLSQQLVGESYVLLEGSRDHCRVMECNMGKIYIYIYSGRHFKQMAIKQSSECLRLGAFFCNSGYNTKFKNAKISSVASCFTSNHKCAGLHYFSLLEVCTAHCRLMECNIVLITSINISQLVSYYASFVVKLVG